MKDDEQVISTHSIAIEQTVTTVEYYFIDHISKHDAQQLAIKQKAKPHHTAKTKTTRTISSTQIFPKPESLDIFVDGLKLNA